MLTADYAARTSHTWNTHAVSMLPASTPLQHGLQVITILSIVFFDAETPLQLLEQELNHPDWGRYRYETRDSLQVQRCLPTIDACHYGG